MYLLQCCMTKMSLSGAVQAPSSFKMLGWSGRWDIISISLVYCTARTHTAYVAGITHTAYVAVVTLTASVVGSQVPGSVM